MIVAHHYDYVVGVDTHARTHTYAIVASKTGDGYEVRPPSRPLQG
jgi:transposase